ncbi:unnamed protein product [Vitrella brassicaformis CCMP3155]|uniref:Uncharacterized protein n=1 Tax=Vitrella brassicaformis (strain CCMP3155) TaxID=1169540 RepID=A0A0G4FYY1_VITBC|nr:unnamed protein product [Vitrella brassicaformis CCMP3155]|eukprot:CEM20830.1 unnamed protein product [Vitrella brassicaformis CCMP3155]
MTVLSARAESATKRQKIKDEQQDDEDRHSEPSVDNRDGEFMDDHNDAEMDALDEPNQHAQHDYDTEEGDGRPQARRGRGSLSPLDASPLADDEDEPLIEEEEVPGEMDERMRLLRLTPTSCPSVLQASRITPAV